MGKTTPKELILVPAKFLFGRITVESDIFYLTLIGVVGAVFAWIISKAFSFGKSGLGKDKKAVVLLWLVIPTALSALVGLWIPVFSYFRILFVLPAMYILLSFGIEKLKGNLKIAAVIFIVLVNIVSTSIYLLNPRFHREDWKGLVEYIAKSSVGFSNSQVVFPTNSQMEAYNYYYNRNKNAMKACGSWLFIDCNKVLIPAYTIENLNTDSDVVWLMRYVQPIFDPEDTVRKEIESLGYTKTSEHDFNGIVVWRYENRN